MPGPPDECSKTAGFIPTSNVSYSTITLPSLNGIELVSELRARGSHVAVIMITAAADAAVERRAAELGIKRIPRKPVEAGFA